jgi:hypothetical protein
MRGVVLGQRIPIGIREPLEKVLNEPQSHSALASKIRTPTIFGGRSSELTLCQT